MNVWIYDENSYPSGFAGGWVPELMPESRGRGLKLRARQTPPRPGKPICSRFFALTTARSKNITAKVKAGETLPEGTLSRRVGGARQNSPWNADRCYVDLLYPGVTEKFLEVTLEPYRKHSARSSASAFPVRSPMSRS